MIAMVERTGERWWQAELYRLTGELLSNADQSAEDGAQPEHFFRKALEVSTRQDARSLALRASMSLCRLWMRQERKRTKGRECLSAIYDSFKEGSSTRDLGIARQMLQELS
jgi:adenylate cyclase